MAPKIAIVYYSTWGHIHQLAKKEKEGVEAAGGSADLWQIPETLSDEILEKMHAKGLKDPEVPVLDSPDKLLPYDGILMGIPTRYGNFPAQWKTFWDSCGKIWATGGYYGKYAGLFVGCGTIGGGQESTCIAAMSTLAHQGMIYVPLGYAHAGGPSMNDVDEVRGGSPWGAGTFAKGDGSRQPSAAELNLAKVQGEEFYKRLSKIDFSK